MSRRSRFQFAILSVLLTCGPIGAAQEPQKQKLDSIYQSAVNDYDAGRFAEAADQLESVLPYAGRSFEVHELLGMIYASLAQNDKAVDQLKLAVQLNPNSAAARTNLGAALLHTGKAALAGEQFRKALSLDPQSYDTNHNLGEFYVQSGKLVEARPLLEQAQKIDPGSYDNGYDLAMTNFSLGQLRDARAVIQDLVKKKDTGELHGLLGQIDEKDGNFLAAANDFETAAHMDPSEENLFDWGCEMLLHRTYEPAIAIFQQAADRYPNRLGSSSDWDSHFTHVANMMRQSKLSLRQPTSTPPIRAAIYFFPRLITARRFRPTRSPRHFAAMRNSSPTTP